MQPHALPLPGDILFARVAFDDKEGEKIRPVLVLEIDENGRVHYAYGTSQIGGIYLAEFVVDPLSHGVAGKIALVKATKFCLLHTYWSSLTNGTLVSYEHIGNVLTVSSLKKDLKRALMEAATGKNHA